IKGIIDIFERCSICKILHRKYGLEHRMKTCILSVLYGNILLQELLIGFFLHFNQIWQFAYGSDFTEAFANALARCERMLGLSSFRHVKCSSLTMLVRDDARHPI